MAKTELDSLDQLMITHFPGEIVRKSYVHTISALKSFPDYVKECLISDHMEPDGTLHPDAVKHISAKVQKSTPSKRDKEILGSRLIELGNIELIDHFLVHTDLRKGQYFTNVSILDSKATVDSGLVTPGPGSYQDLLKGGLWGAASLEYMKSGEFAKINMNNFESFQTGTPNLKRFIKRRESFTRDEWLDLIMRTIGLNPNLFSLREKWLYTARLIPLVEKFSNSLEFGPPQTGKSYLFLNISEHVRLLGDISPAKLIYDQNSGRNGLVFTKDAIIFDEINKSTSNIRRIVPSLQQIMASNRAERGDLDAMTDVSLHFQGNPIKRGQSGFNYDDSIKALPQQMHDCAFLDRLHRYIHGWEFTRFSPEFNNQHLGLLISYFGQICHRFRLMDVDQFISDKIQLKTLKKDGKIGLISSLDNNAVISTLSGLIKLIYPHQKLDDKEWGEIVQFAIELRQNVIDEMIKIDPHQYRKIEYELKSQTSIPEIEEIPLVVPPSDELDGLAEESEEQISIDPGMAEKDEEIVFPPLKMNATKELTEQVPYWYVKYLMEFDHARVKNSSLFYTPKKDTPFTTITDGNSALSLHKSELGQSIKYDDEEKKSSGLINKFNLLKSKIDDFSKDLAQIQNYVNVLKKYYCVHEPSPGNSLLLIDFEEISKGLPTQEEIGVQILLKKIKSEEDGIMEVAAKSPDILLQYDFHPVIIPIESRLSQMDILIKKWSSYHSDYITKVKPLIIKALELKISMQKLFKKDDEKKFGGKRFTLCAIDLNNFHISYKNFIRKKYPKRHVTRSQLISYVVRKFTLFFNKFEQVYILFFATKQLAGYEQSFNKDFANCSECFIESLRKHDKYVDVDANLTSYTSIFIDRNSSQISDFYLCCGDIDLHSVIDLAHKNKISAQVLAPFKNTLNRQYHNIADDYHTLFD